ncbi:MAG: epoxyqueuosine reductase QueH [Geobacteraceae bacterium]|nr:epoxyqueuosine reductase QueH [Geobacteraceae bacterium]
MPRLASITDNGSSFQEHAKPRLLLHACCAPCSSAVVERLAADYAITIYFYNPNIHPRAEYIKRRDELQRWCSHIAGINCIVADYVPAKWMDQVRDLEREPERGRRCNRCFRLRLQHAAKYASAHDYDLFATVLSISPHKRFDRINRLGIAIARRYGVDFYAANFKKKNGYKRSVEISRELKFYRQNYCGCVFSASQTQART